VGLVGVVPARPYFLLRNVFGKKAVFEQLIPEISDGNIFGNRLTFFPPIPTNEKFFTHDEKIPCNFATYF